MEQIFSKETCRRLLGLRDAAWALFTNHRAWAWSYIKNAPDLALQERDKSAIAAIDYRIAAEKRIKELEEKLQHLHANATATEKKLDHLERLVEAEGWQWMDAANCCTPHTATCHRCRVTPNPLAGADLRDIDPNDGASGLRDEQRDRRRAGKMVWAPPS